ncbi:MAG TPA: hydroxymethylpyrimidine/phosphomethylpyrimidine kinase [Pseudomonadales bacterium]|nr:hydroxymethylpyrimidine/phosphomethylpyrimidine kinase [Pseudomonadales bacterium]
MRPLILCLGGHDPTGGAGIQADAEAAAAAGCHALTVVTALTVQNSHDIARIEPVPAGWITAQTRCLLDDFAISAIKIGLLGSTAAIDEVAALLETALSRLPLVVDPILRSGGGHLVTDHAYLDALRQRLLPRATCLTPNREELFQLAGVDDEASAVGRLLDRGCEHLLVSGGHDGDTPWLENRLYGRQGLIQRDRWPRLPHRFHGSGCTLAALLCAQIALGQPLPTAVRLSSEQSHRAMVLAEPLGGGQWIPRRIAPR